MLFSLELLLSWTNTYGPNCQLDATPALGNVPNISALLCAISGHLGPVPAAVEELAKQVCGTALKNETTCIRGYIKAHNSSHNQETELREGHRHLSSGSSSISAACLNYRTANPRSSYSDKQTLL